LPAILGGFCCVVAVPFVSTCLQHALDQVIALGQPRMFVNVPRAPDLLAGDLAGAQPALQG